LDGNFAVELSGQLPDGDNAHDRRQNQEAKNRVEKQKPNNPKRELALPQ
jgi:hypothetical protein